MKAYFYDVEQTWNFLENKSVFLNSEHRYILVNLFKMSLFFEQPVIAQSANTILYVEMWSAISCWSFKSQAQSYFPYMVN